MKFTSDAIILSSRKFGERDLICQIFTREHGLYSGFVRAGQTSKRTAIYQVGNLISANWKARLDNQLGSLEAELLDAIYAKTMHSMPRLSAVLSACAILRKTLAEREEHKLLYEEFLEFLTTGNWQQAYVNFELALLRDLGFGLDLSECAVTGAVDDLVYISPRTGRAVSSKGAIGYEDKLITMPNFMFEHQKALEVTEYFLNKNAFFPHNWHLPEERVRLKKIINTEMVLSA
jgi:DNA repair protein RecO (recombination protein O)